MGIIYNVKKSRIYSSCRRKMIKSKYGHQFLLTTATLIAWLSPPLRRFESAISCRHLNPVSGEMHPSFLKCRHAPGTRSGILNLLVVSRLNKSAPSRLSDNGLICRGASRGLASAARSCRPTVWTRNFRRWRSLTQCYKWAAGMRIIADILESSFFFCRHFSLRHLTGHGYNNLDLISI